MSSNFLYRFNFCVCHRCHRPKCNILACEWSEYILERPLKENETIFTISAVIMLLNVEIRKIWIESPLHSCLSYSCSCFRSNWCFWNLKSLCRIQFAFYHSFSIIYRMYFQISHFFCELDCSLYSVNVHNAFALNLKWNARINRTKTLFHRRRETDIQSNTKKLDHFMCSGTDDFTIFSNADN